MLKLETISQLLKLRNCSKLEVVSSYFSQDPFEWSQKNINFLTFCRILRKFLYSSTSFIEPCENIQENTLTWFWIIGAFVFYLKKHKVVVLFCVWNNIISNPVLWCSFVLQVRHFPLVSSLDSILFFIQPKFK